MTDRRSIHVEGLHHGGAPIPQAAVVRGLLISGGINGMDHRTGEVPASAEEQVALVFENIGLIMRAAGGSLDDIVKLTLFTADPAVRKLINGPWLELFPDEHSRPARHVQAVAALSAPLVLQAEIYAQLGE